MKNLKKIKIIQAKREEFLDLICDNMVDHIKKIIQQKKGQPYSYVHPDSLRSLPPPKPYQLGLAFDTIALAELWAYHDRYGLKESAQRIICDAFEKSGGRPVLRDALCLEIKAVLDINGPANNSQKKLINSIINYFLFLLMKEGEIMRVRPSASAMGTGESYVAIRWMRDLQGQLMPAVDTTPPVVPGAASRYPSHSSSTR